MARIVLENVRVDFPIYATQRNLRTAIFNRATGGLIQRQGKNQNRVVVTALSGVSMALEDGDRVGLIGHNGSGKSTLLKVLAGIYEPIEGRLLVEGAVTPLFDMMPGLDPEDSGYENIFTAGLLLGLTRQEIESRIPRIEELSELGEYLSLPVRTYSAGMRMRLGFSLVTSVEPNILLMDEGIGAGDARFEARAEQRLKEFIGRSRILVLASHSNRMIRAMCNKAALMQAGQILAVGPVDEICEQYSALVHGTMANATSSRPGHSGGGASPRRSSYSEESIRDAGLDDRHRRTTGAVRITRALAKDESGKPRWDYQSGETIKFCFAYEVMHPISELLLLFRLNLASDELAGQAESTVVEIQEILDNRQLPVGHAGEIEISVPTQNLRPNKLSLYVWLGRASRLVSYDVIDVNVELPEIHLLSASGEQASGGGIVSLNYQLRQVETEDLSKSLSA